MINEISQKEKAAALLTAAINQTPEKLAETYKELGYVEMSAIALGTACRFCGADTVRVLTEGGAKFSFPRFERIEKEYSCFTGRDDENYRTNYSLCLLNITKHIKGAGCFKGTKLTKQAVREDKKTLPFLADEERIKVLDYLYKTRDITDFDPSEMLFFAYFAQDDVIANELKRLGVTLSETRIGYITNGGAGADGYWFEWCSLMGHLNKENFIPIMEKIRGEFTGKFHFTEWLYEGCKELFTEPQIFGFILDNFKQEKMNKVKIIREFIDNNAVSVLPLTEKAGWLANTKRRDQLIEYAQTNNNIECTAWLLDFKNRTANFAAERKNAEKRIQRELNAGPNSVLMLKKIWSYKKQEDGTLTITNYKGLATEVTVPETIGKSTVAAIGKNVFATESLKGTGVFTRATPEQIELRTQITKILLPKTLKKIGTGAFYGAANLKEIEIPDGVEEIGDFAFRLCSSLTRIVIPGSVRRIGAFAFACCSLKEVIIRDGVVELGESAFGHNQELERVEIPDSVKVFRNFELLCRTEGVFSSCLKLTVYCGKGSEAEKYCRKNDIKYIV